MHGSDGQLLFVTLMLYPLQLPTLGGRGTAVAEKLVIDDVDGHKASVEQLDDIALGERTRSHRK